MIGPTRSTKISRRDASRLLAAIATVVTGAAAASALRAAVADPGCLEKGAVTMTQDLATLAAEHFEPLIGETFTIGDHQVTLREVHRQKMRSRLRQQFSLLFNAPRDLALRSESLPVSHPAIGRHELLVTQVLDGPDGTALEICFS
jgi:hypothetical protein